MRIAPTLLALFLAAGLTGCNTEPATNGDQPGVITPENGKSGRSDSTSSTDNGPAKGDRVLAEVNGVKIPESQVLPALYDSYGLDVLLKVVQLDMARAATAAAGITVSAADIDTERNLTLALAFPDQRPEDYDNLLTQLLSQQRVSRAEFGIVMETNANLRASVKSAATSEISDDAIRAEFNAIYGERVRIRHIALNNLQEVGVAQRRLATEPFEKVAREMSANRVTGAQGGELAPFARTSGGFSPEFIQAAFALKPGETSTDVIQEGRFYHVIKSIEHIPPQVVKYESVRDSVREELILKRQNALMNMKRGEMAQLAIKNLQINEPTLKKQFADRLAAANPTPADRDEVRRSLDEKREQLNAATVPTTGPTTAPTASPTTTPMTQP
jgi:parvulin-like peptidyl-prolyl isomerase